MEDVARYSSSYGKGWDQLRHERYARQIELGIINKAWELSPRPDDIPSWDSLDAAHRQFEQRRMAVYAAMVDRMDQNIGRLLAKLREWKVEENTLVIFLSDNGANPYDLRRKPEIAPGQPGSRWMCGVGWANLSNTPFRLYKRNQHEGGIATPFIARWPAVIQKRGAITDVPAHVVDLMATCLQLAGCDYHTLFEGKASPAPTGTSGAVLSDAVIPPLAGKSLAPIFHGEFAIERDALFFQLYDHRAVHAGIWKLSSREGRPWELYRMDTDRTEVHDLAQKEPAKLKELEAIYQKWWDRPAIVDRYTVHDQVPSYVDPLASDKHSRKQQSAEPHQEDDDD
jgi:arylsulfatase